MSEYTRTTTGSCDHGGHFDITSSAHDLLFYDRVIAIFQNPLSNITHFVQISFSSSYLLSVIGVTDSIPSIVAVVL